MNKIRHTILFYFGLFFLLISANCAQQDKSNSITINQFKENLKNDTSIVVLDVRTPEELIGPLGKIESAINIPIQFLEQRINELDQYKNKEIDVICRSGNRSRIGTEILIKHGFKAKNVLGGMKEINK